MYELEASICKKELLNLKKSDASSRRAGHLRVMTYFCYFEPLITQQMEASGSPFLGEN